MRVRAAGSSGVTTVNAVQTTVKGVRNEEMTEEGRLTVTGSMKEIKHRQRYGQKKNG